MEALRALVLGYYFAFNIPLTLAHTKKSRGLRSGELSSQTSFWPKIEVRPDHVQGVKGGPVRHQDHIPCVIEVGLDPEEHMSLKDQL